MARREGGNLALTLAVQVGVQGRAKQHHPTLEPQPLPGIVQLRDKLRLHPQGQHFAILGLTSAALSLADGDLALFGLADLLDEAAERRLLVAGHRGRYTGVWP